MVDISSAIDPSITLYCGRDGSGIPYVLEQQAGGSWRMKKGNAVNPTSWTALDTANDPSTVWSRSYAVAMGSDNIIHCVGVFPDSKNGIIRYSRFDMSTDTWSETDTAVESGLNTATFGNFCAIAVDSNNIPHIAHMYVAKSMGTDIPSIGYNNRIGGSWNTTHVAVDGADVSGANDCNEHIIFIDEDNFPVIAYERGPNGTATEGGWLAYSTSNDPTSFTLTQKISNSNAAKGNIAVAITENDDQIYFWQTSSNNYTVLKKPAATAYNGSWTTVNPASDTFPTNGLMSLVALGGDDVVLIQLNGNTDLRVNTLDASAETWSGWTTLVDGTAGTVILQNADSHWFSRDTSGNDVSTHQTVNSRADYSFVADIAATTPSLTRSYYLFSEPLGGTDALTGNAITGAAPAIDSQSLGQTHVIAGDAIQATGASIDSQTLGQTHVLAGDEITAGVPAIDSQTLSQSYTLTGDPITGAAPIIDSQALTQTHILSHDNLATGPPVVDSAAIGQTHNLAGNAIQGASPAIDSQSLGQTHALSADAIDGTAPVLDSSDVGQSYPLSGDEITVGAPVIDSSAIGQTHVLAGDELTDGAPVLDSVALGQTHTLTGDEIRGTAGGGSSDTDTGTVVQDSTDAGGGASEDFSGFGTYDYYTLYAGSYSGGTLSNGNFDLIAGNPAIRCVGRYRSFVIGSLSEHYLILELVGTHPNSGWDTMTVDGVVYNRTDMTFEQSGGNTRWYIYGAGAISGSTPFLDNVGLSIDIVFNVGTANQFIPVLDSVPLGQTHALSGDAIQGAAPVIDSQTLGQSFVLTGDPIQDGAPTVDSATLGQVHALSGDAITGSAPVLDSQALGQTHDLLGDEITANLVSTDTETGTALTEEITVVPAQDYEVGEGFGTNVPSIFWGGSYNLGSLSDGNFALTANASIYALYHAAAYLSGVLQLQRLTFALNGEHDNNNWVSLDINGTVYTRASADYFYDSGNDLSVWRWDGQTSPFNVGSSNTIDAESAGAPVIGEGFFGQIVALSADEITVGAPVIDSAALGQTHVLAGNEITTGVPQSDSVALGQTHDLTADAIDGSAPVVDSVALGQVHDLSGNAIDVGAPVLDSATLTENAGTDVLAGDPITGSAPVLDSQTLGQVHALAGDAIDVGAPAVDSQALGQVHILAGDEITDGAPVIDSAALSEVNALAGDPITTGVPVSDSVPLGQVHVLAGDAIDVGAPQIDSQALGQVHDLSADAIDVGAPVLDSATLSEAGFALLGDAITVGAPVVDSATLGQTHDLSGDAITGSAPAIDSATLGQVHALAGDEITTAAPVVDSGTLGVVAVLAGDEITTGAPVLDSPALGQVHALAGDEVTTTPVLDSGSLTQVHDLTGDSITGSAPVVDQTPLIIGTVETPADRTVKTRKQNRTVRAQRQSRNIRTQTQDRVVKAARQNRIGRTSR